MKAGWGHATIKDICVVDWGNTNLTKSSYVENGAYLAVSAAGCDGRIAHAEHKAGTPVLSAIGAQCGRMFFPEEDFTAIKNTITLTPFLDKCDSRFLYYLLTYVELPQRGAGQPFISKGDIQSFAVSVPPLPEQRRVVRILDEAFEGIAKATANAETNLNNARELFESHLNTILSNPGLDWAEKKLEQLCEIKHGFAFKSESFAKDNDEHKPIIITPGNFTEDGRLEFTAKNTKRFVGRLPEELLFKRGELVIVMTDLSSKMKILGKPAFIDRDNILHNQRIGRIVFKESIVTKELLYYFMRSRKFIDNIKQSATGTMVKHTAPKRILSNSIQFPPPVEAQQAIVAKLDELAAETKRLEAIYKQKLALLAELKQSLLHKAFSGEL